MSIAVGCAAVKEDRGRDIEERLSTLQLTGRRRPLGARTRPPINPLSITSDTMKQRQRPRHGENKWRREYSPTAPVSPTSSPTSRPSHTHPKSLLRDLMNSSGERTPTPIPLGFPLMSTSHSQHRRLSKLTSVSRFPTPPTYTFITSPSPDNVHLPTITVTNTDHPSQDSPTPSVIYTPDMEITTPLPLSLPALLDAERKLPKLHQITVQEQQGRWSCRNYRTVKLPALDCTCSIRHQRSHSFSDSSLEKLPAL